MRRSTSPDRRKSPIQLSFHILITFVFTLSTHTPQQRMHTHSHTHLMHTQEQERKSRVKGIEAVKSNIQAAKAVSRVLRTSLGPKGMDKLLQGPDGDIVISTYEIVFLVGRRTPLYQRQTDTLKTHTHPQTNKKLNSKRRCHHIGANGG